MGVDRLISEKPIHICMKRVIVGNYKKLNIWIKSLELVKVVYDLVKKYPDNEKFGLISQIKEERLYQSQVI